MSGPVICFGQQPCGFFPKRFLAAKIRTARTLQREIGGRIVFFYHDSDHDPRETQTLLRHRQSGAEARLNFAFANRIQKKWSPLFHKRLVPGWQENQARQLPAYVESAAAAAFRETSASDVSAFCLEVYRRQGLLEGVEVVRSGDPAFRRRACPIADFYVDVTYEGETVRARLAPGNPGDDPFSRPLRLHEGGPHFIGLPPQAFTAEQISPARDTRLRWMQSVVGCTHYVCGAGEQAYLRKEDAPEIVYVPRMTIDRSDEAYTEIGLGTD
ncbi:MAG TPA: hypothetical protein VGL42_18010 [Opitutaceae bacterium]|jgi:hypothetical protein